MGDTSRAPGFGADADEAAFQRLEQGVAALRRDTARLRQQPAAALGALHDPRELDASLAEVNRRIDALASRANAPTDPGPILAALTTVEEKISSLTARLDRFAEQSVLTEAMASATAKIDGLAARLDARLNQLEEKQAEFSAKLAQAMSEPKPAPPQPAPAPVTAPPAASPLAAPAPAAMKPPAPAPLASPPPPATPARAPTPPPSLPPASAFATLPKAEPEPRRSHLPALLVLVVMVFAAAAALAWLRPDLVKSDKIVHEWLEPARDKAMHWLHLSRDTSATSPAVLVASAGPVAPAGASTEATGAPVQNPTAAMPAPVSDAGPPVSASQADPADTRPDSTTQSATPEQTASAGTEGAVTDVPPPAEIAMATVANSPANTAVSRAGPSITSAPPAPAPAPAASHIVVGARADVWLMVQDDQGRTLLARVLHQGETWTAPDRRGLRLSTGNAGATFVSIDGVTWPSLGSNGGVRHDLPLDATLLSVAIAQTRKSKRSAGERSANDERAKPFPGASKRSKTVSQ